MNRRAEATPPECALAVEMFNHFCSAGTMKQILALHREICNTLNLKPNRLPDFYPKLKAKLASSWKAQALFKKFDARANHKVYGKGRACTQNKVLIIGAGPCGLRAAIECQLLGAKVVVIEKRDRMSRNNVLHLWPFVIQDLRALGAKKFLGKFCAGSIDHISIRQLQCILLKVSLLLGVEFHEGVSFEELLEPTVTENNESVGWRARVSPSEHPVSMYEFDALVGADGKRNTLDGFKRKEFRGKLAMAITANFINRHSEQEASVPEISGVAFIFNQKFFKELYEVTGIDLENIVYYKDDTHYFVMTAKKHSLLDKGVLLNDYTEVTRLLSVENVDRAALMRYAQEAARFSTGGRLPLRDFALNHYGEPDVALFDFTSMYAAENASMVYERRGRRVLCQLVGDSLLEPFWPTGSGCARGFLSALDAAWAVRAWGHLPHPHPLHVVAERESIYRLLAQTTPENLHRNLGAYTLDPGTRYPNLNRTAVSPHRVTSFYDADEPLPLDAAPALRKRRRESEVPDDVLAAWVGVTELRAAASAPALAAAVRRYRPDLLPHAAPPAHVYNVLHHELGIPLPSSASINGGGTSGVREVPDTKVRSYLSRVYAAFKGEVPHVHHASDVFHQLKQQTDRHLNNDHSISAYSNAAAETDKSHSSYKRKRRARAVSTDPADTIRRQIGRLDLNEVTTLARLIEGRDDGDHAGGDLVGRQRALHDRILALFDPDDSPDLVLLRDSLSRLLQGKTETRLAPDRGRLAHFSHDDKHKPTKPPRRLKGLDPTTVRVRDSADTEATVVRADVTLDRSSSEKPVETGSKDRRPSDGVGVLLTPEACDTSGGSIEVRRRSSSVELLVGIFERTEQKRCTPERPARRSVSETMAERVAWAHAALHSAPAPASLGDVEEPPARSPSIGAPELETRRSRVVELMAGRRANGGGGSGGRRRAQRDVTRARVARSVALLAADRRQTLAYPSAADLTHDVGLQQYRASAPHFDDRVRHLERQLQHYEEGRIVGGGGRTSAGGGARVARLAAELSGPPAAAPPPPRPSKPKDLMRSVGKIERDDWNMREIERKIMENRLGRPEPRAAEKVPKWDREQFLGRQRKLKEGDGSDEKWGEIDETLHKFDQKRRDSGRPDHGTKKVANLATKFVKKDPDPEPAKIQTHKHKDEVKKSWRGPMTAGVQCASCGTRVFAAEGVTADGLTLHRACFRCAICSAVLRPGNYTMERFGSRLVCLRHGGIAPGADVPDPAQGVPAPTPERISLELSDSGAKEIDEDEWTDRNCLASETSAANNVSEEEDSSSDEYTDAGEGDAAPARSPSPQRIPAHAHADIYFSDDSFGYDDYSDDGGESSGGESCSRMRALREARRREVPAEARQPTDSSEVESEEESSSEEESASSATEVSTDSEFARDEGHLPAILVTPAPPPAPPALAPAPAAAAAARDYPLSRALSTGGLATQRALELKRRYLLGEPSPPAVRKSDSTSQIDTKLAAFTNNITEFQKMLNPAAGAGAPPLPVSTVTAAYHAKVDPQPMPDIIKNLCGGAPVDLLAKTESSLLHDYISERSEPGSESARLDADDGDDDDDAVLESDSLSDRTERESSRGPLALTPAPAAAAALPRLEVHDDSGELVHLDSLTSGADEPATGTGTTASTAVLPAGEEGSSSSREASTLALTESSASSWAGEGSALEAAGTAGGRRAAPRHLARPKSVRAAPDLDAHICGRTDTDRVGAGGDVVRFENASDHFAFADEGEGEPEPAPPANRGYMELVDDEYSPARDRSMDFIERVFSETVYRPTPPSPTPAPTPAAALVSAPPSSRTEIVHTLPSDAYLDNDELSPTRTETESSSERTTGGSGGDSRAGRDDTDPRTEGEVTSCKTTTGGSAAGLEPSLESLTLSSVASPPLASPSESVTCSLAAGGAAGAVGGRGGGEGEAEAGRMARLRRERDYQTEVVRRLVLARLGSERAPRRRLRPVPPAPPPPVPPPPTLTPVPAPVTPAFSDPELARASSRRNTIMRTISVYINRHLHPRHKWASEPNLSTHEPVSRVNVVHKSTGALQEAPQEAPPVPPPPAGYRPPPDKTRYRPVTSSKIPVSCESERDAMQLWFEARWARLMAQRRARDDRPAAPPPTAPTAPGDRPARRLAKLERRLARPLSAEQQAATVAELVQVTATRDAHQALLNADRRRSAASGGE